MGMLAATEEVVTSIPEALVNTVIGMGTVFVVLILISFIIYLLKFLFPAAFFISNVVITVGFIIIFCFIFCF